MRATLKSNFTNTQIKQVPSKTVKAKFIFGFFIFLLVVPYLQNTINFFKVPELQGYIVRTKQTEFSLSEWFKGSFQENEEKYINENFGFRNALIRFYNQISFDLFKSVKINDVIVGKENYLFQKNYIEAYLGENFMGDEKISQRIDKLKYVQEELKKQNKTILVVIAPGKASFYPEYLPDHFIKKNNNPTNYFSIIRECEKYKINYIDFQKYFNDIKEKSTYILYPKYGIHWSHYGMLLALDSIVTEIEHLRNINMPELSWNKVEMDLPKEGDNDILEGLNLLFPLESDSLAYPVIEVDENEGQERPSLLVIGDSFYKQMLKYSPKLFGDNQFWYYNREVWPPDKDKSSDVRNYDLQASLNKYDVFMILSTEVNHELGWGFIENAYDILKYGYVKENKSEFMKKVANMRKYIKTRQDWMKLIEEKAAKNNISVDSALTNDAIWMVRHSKQ